MTLAAQVTEGAPAAGAAGLLAPLGRAMLGSLFLISGVSKIGGYAATQGYMEAMGVPGALLPAVIALEVLAPIALIVGWNARIAAFLLAGFSVVAAVLFHGNVADQIQQIMFLKNIAVAGGLLTIVANGPGAFALTPRR